MSAPHRRTRAALAPLAVALAAGCAATPRGEPWSARPDPDGITFHAADRTLLRYRYGDVPFKPYVESLRTPAGVNILRDAPHDHLHHHGLMFAVAVEGADFWGEPPGAGRQKPRYLQILVPTPVGGLHRTGLLQTLDWLGPPAQGLLLQEKRTLEAWRADDLPASLVSWQSELHTPPGREAVELTGRNYFGLGLRFVQSMDAAGRFFNADRREGVAGTNDATSTWCAYTASAEGRPVTVAVFDHPANARPARWFTMDTPFAYLGATPGLHHESLTLRRSKPLRFRYGIAVWDGQPETRQIDALARRWVKLPAAP